MHRAVPALGGDPQLGVGLGAWRYGNARAHAVGAAEEQPAGGAQVARLADAQVDHLDLADARLAQRGVETLHIAGRAFQLRRLVAKLGQAQAPGADLDLAELALAEAAVAA